MQPSHGSSRTAALAAYHILDTLPEQAYDDITKLAAHICGTPMAMINFLPDDRLWTKAQVGLGSASSMPLSSAFCRHALNAPAQLLIVPDTQADRRFADNPLVTAAPHIRFYAGAPLCTPDGTAVGTVCVLDRQPRRLDSAQTAALAALARQVSAQLELRRTTAALRHSEQRFKAFMDNSPTLVFLKDAHGRYQYINAPASQLVGRSAAQILGRSDSELWPPKIAAKLQQNDEQVLASGHTEVQEEHIPTPEGQNRTWQIYKFPVPVDAERWIGGIALNITAQKQYTAYLEAIQQQFETTVETLTRTSQTDALTNIANRRAFDAALAAHVVQAHQSAQPLALIMIDVDHFKQYNDSFGHQAGDQVLQQVAQLLRHAGRSSDFIARYGGEEFVVLLPNTSAEHAQVVAERCRHTIECSAWPQRPITISSGVAASADGDVDPVQLLRAADAALYQAKRQGRNRVIIAR